MQQVGFECPHHLAVSPLLTLHSENEKVTLIGPFYFPKVWDKKTEATAKVTVRVTNKQTVTVIKERTLHQRNIYYIDTDREMALNKLSIGSLKFDVIFLEVI